MNAWCRKWPPRVGAEVRRRNGRGIVAAVGIVKKKLFCTSCQGNEVKVLVKEDLVDGVLVARSETGALESWIWDRDREWLRTK